MTKEAPARPEPPIPEEAFLQHFGVLGKTGSGKTTAAVGLVEAFHAAGRRTVAVDPTDVWWGIGHSADGKRPGLPFVVFGGLHAHIPLTADMGERLGELVASSAFSCVISTRLLSVHERERFFIGFAEALGQSNRRPLHLILDEAHLFAPQSGARAGGNAPALLHATNNLVSGGRVLGLRIGLLTQRPAKLHKDSLTQVETLIAMRLIAPQDRKAVQEWVGEWGDAGKGREVLNTLASMPRGEGWVWAPESDFLERVAFPATQTFDSRRAPEEGEDEPLFTSTLDGLDFDAIRDALRISEPIKRPEKSQVEAQAACREQWWKDGFEAGRAQGYQEGVKAGAEEARREAYSTALAKLRPVLDGFVPVVRDLEAGAYADPATPTPPPPPPPKVVELASRRPPAAEKSAQDPTPVFSPSPEGGDQLLTPRRRAILDALRWAEALLQKEAVERILVAFLADASPNASGFQNNLGALRTAGFIAYPSGGMVALTDKGRAAAAPPYQPPTSARLREVIGERLQPALRRMFDAICAAYPSSFARAGLAETIGQSAQASGFQNNLGRLRSLGLVDYPEPGHVRAEGFLFGAS